jgi:hypothetical protein
MKQRVIITYALAAVLAASVACSRRNDACTGDASTTSAQMPAPATAAPGQVVVVVPQGAEPPAQAQAPAPAPPRAAPTAEPETPAWVPDSGRLSIIQAPDLARNLGIVEATPRDASAPVAEPR